MTIFPLLLGNYFFVAQNAYIVSKFNVTFEIYRFSFFFQGAASLLLTTLEKEKELLRVFLKVSQMENLMLRRMNLSSFLMVSFSFHLNT